MKYIKISLIILVLIIGFLFLFKKPKEKEPVDTVKIIDNINDYKLKENSSSYYKSLFEELKKVISNEKTNDEEYAKIISKLFITDLFTLNNKINQSDVGGVQFVYKDYEDDFINLVQDTLYSHLENNIYGDRKQKLPIVQEVIVNSVTDVEFEYNDNLYNGYLVQVTINYKEDMGYLKEAELTLIKNDKLLEVAVFE